MPERDVDLAKRARDAVGDRKTSQGEFGELIGVPVSTVTKREVGQIRLTPTTRLLYQALAGFGRMGGMDGRVRFALESIPAEVRSEGSSLVVLDRLAREAGVEWVVDSAMCGANEVGGSPAAESVSISGIIRVIDAADREIGRRSREDTGARPEWVEARRLLAQGRKQIEIALEREAEMAS